jgi:ABC-type sugar transport system ATPase subunit
MTRAQLGSPAVEAIGITKSFGSLDVLRGVSLSLYRGEITAVLGDNGAGKSTFMKVLSGEHRPDGGELRFDGEPVEIRSIQDAQRLGVETVYQDLALVPDLSVAENIYLGREIVQAGWRGWGGTVDRRAMLAETRQVLNNLGITLPSYRAPTRSLSGGQRQAVAVARAMKWARHAVLMDEPTAALGARQREMVYEAIRSAARRDLAVLLISHDIPQVLQLAHSIAVLRLGRVVAQFDPAQVGVRDVIDAMLGEGGQA